MSHRFPGSYNKWAGKETIAETFRTLPLGETSSRHPPQSMRVSTASCLALPKFSLRPRYFGPPVHIVLPGFCRIVSSQERDLSALWIVELDRQVLVVFCRMRIEDEDVRESFREVLRDQTHDAQEESRAQRSPLSCCSKRPCWSGNMINCSICGSTIRLTRRFSLPSRRNCETDSRRPSFSLTCSTARTTKPPTWPSKFLNFLKR